jgi:transcriptional regulator with XRE-family HTH domain
MALPSSSAQHALELLGSRLRELRVSAGLSGRDLGRLTGWHSSKISKIEYGRQAPSVSDVHAWCLHCGAERLASELTASLHAVEGMFLEWQRLEGGGLRKSNEAEARVWERTKRFRIYSSTVIPGPLQTGPYISAVLQSLQRQRQFPDTDLDETVQVRLDKQKVVHKPGNSFAIVLEESVLRAPIGGAEVMAAQLGYLLEAIALPAVSLGIIPLDSDRSSIWTAEAFWMFDDSRVTVELVSGYLTITQPSEITLYRDAFNRYAEQAAFGAKARALIAAAIAATA